MIDGRTAIRLCVAFLVTLSVGTVAVASVQGVDGRNTDQGPAFETGERAVEPRNGTTVVTTSQYGNNFLVAFAPNGSVLHYDEEYAVYNEIVHVPGTRATVIYVATRNLDRRSCHSTVPCNRNVVERLNLTTGDRERLYERTNPRSRNQWHAIDIVDEDHVVVGDIAYDRVFVLDTERELIEWEWEAQTDLPLSGGGIYPGDWTHLNHVEALPDGRIMVSLRNQDQVVFLDRETGLQEEWTLGDDGDHDTLYEQHNPQYITEENGGPAVLVADSENGRIVEYQREAGEWRQSWEWSDSRMQWPRDADRLSNGHTMIVDSNGARVMELDRDGDVVWQVETKGAYDIEHIDGAPEAGDPESAERLGLETRSVGGTGPRESVPDPASVPKQSLDALDAVLPSIVVNGILYVLPPWFGIVELFATLSFGATAAVWAGAELWWAGWRIRWPVFRRDEDS
ncbi:aryl-sulfate sulfotransferase [Halobaculum roseum]|uniref:Aryl-sulfate sulfotransferase n=1 Tax=Halobaculum roseum TaxID=2175149 RepID=A0ABD5MGE2_9EURY|nr:aryl-sulfate sulfotransferase [Halobaculum roseum]QZY02291.1 aryl-sulfate sulfotransferase [Halobaculum roseum]